MLLVESFFGFEMVLEIVLFIEEIIEILCVIVYIILHVILLGSTVAWRWLSSPFVFPPYIDIKLSFFLRFYL